MEYMVNYTNKTTPHWLTTDLTKSHLRIKIYVVGQEQ